MEAATATYGGTLLDENGKPMADRTLQIYVKTSLYQAVAPQQTDRQGRFRFTGLPCNVPLQLNLQNDTEVPRYFLFDRDRMLNPGEIRENEVLKPQRADESSSQCDLSGPAGQERREHLPERPPEWHAPLVASLGDDSGDTARTIYQLFDYDDERTRAVLSYLTLRVDPAQLKSEAAALTKFGWPKPEPGEIVLVALDGDQKMIAAQRIATNHVATAVSVGADFLKQHRPPAAATL